MNATRCRRWGRSFGCGLLKISRRDIDLSSVCMEPIRMSRFEKVIQSGNREIQSSMFWDRLHRGRPEVGASVGVLGKRIHRGWTRTIFSTLKTGGHTAFQQKSNCKLRYWISEKGHSNNDSFMLLTGSVKLAPEKLVAPLDLSAV